MTRLTLTFDNGPDPETTPFVLAALADREIPATFFVVGDQLARSGGLSIASAARAAGHRIGNHSMTHSVPLGQLSDAVRAAAEITDAEEALGSLACRLFRPFGGGGVLGPHLFSRAAVDLLVAESYTVALWNSVPRDWEEPVGWVDVAMADVAANGWTVLVLHDLPTGAMDQLPRFLDGVLDAGVEVVDGFPDSCIPLRDGVVQWPFEDLVT
ncbi:MAG: polysaccharide deacetylase family protein [Acidimicrobiales bacterium]